MLLPSLSPPPPFLAQKLATPLSRTDHPIQSWREAWPFNCTYNEQTAPLNDILEFTPCDGINVGQHEPNSAIHFSYFSRSAAETDLETFLRAVWKSSMVVGMCISSREMLRISSGVKPSIRRLMAIREASLQQIDKTFKLVRSNLISQRSRLRFGRTCRR